MTAMAITNKKQNLHRLTVCAPSQLLENVQQRRNELIKLTGVRISTSSVVSGLLKAGLEATSTAPNN